MIFIEYVVVIFSIIFIYKFVSAMGNQEFETVDSINIDYY